MSKTRANVSKSFDDWGLKFSDRPSSKGTSSNMQRSEGSSLNIRRLEIPSLSEGTFDEYDTGYSQEIISSSKSVSDASFGIVPQNKLKGVITKIEDEVVFITLQIPNGEETKISVPYHVLAEDLRYFATPIWVMLDSSTGYERLTFIKRDEITPLEETQEFQDISRWIDTL